VEVEGRIDKAILQGLERRGHDVKLLDGWANGKVMGIRFDEARGVIAGAVSPRRSIGYGLGW
jgi:gamma-glutamyltranspeptidase/glutathione hydrolase